MISWKMFSLSLVISVVSGVFGATVKKGPYLIFEGDNTSMTIMWQMDVLPTTDFLIKWGLDVSCNLGSMNCDKNNYTDDYLYKYTITGLTPGIKYFYQAVGVGSGSFRTAPENNNNVVLWGYGDSQTDAGIATLIQENIKQEYSKNSEQQTICLRLGDWTNSNPVMSANVEEKESNWTDFHFNDYGKKFLNEIPMVGPKGNHEISGTLFKKYYPFPYKKDINIIGNGNFYWSFDYGPVHFVVLDVSEDAATEVNYNGFDGYNKRHVSYTDQTEWLDEDLSKSDKFWKIVLVHSPGWSAQVGNHDNNDYIQNVLNKIFQKHGVTWVLSGHIHYFAHAQVPGDGKSKVVNYITSGGGGSRLVALPDGGKTSFECKVEDPVNNGNPKSEYHYFKIHIIKDPVLGDRLNFYVYNIKGEMIYSYTEEASFVEKFTIPLQKMIPNQFSSDLKIIKKIIPSSITELK